jgi:hypothetical protein
MPDESLFLDELGDLAREFGWRVQSFAHGSQEVAVVGFDALEPFEQLLWIHDPEANTLRCLLLLRQRVPADRLQAALELCARVNDGLSFGCLEYAFSDQTLSFRDSSEVEGLGLDAAIRRTTSRVLSLGQRYFLAVDRVLSGVSALIACADAEAGDQ